ncbi:Acetoin utilization protein AcuC [compost metagenome]
MLNDQAVAARYLLNQKLANRILIIDLDVHQGNGTAHIFRDDERVFTYSIHGDKNFPFIKEQSDLDIPVADGLEDDVYLQLLGDSLPLIFEKVKPDFVFYQAGVDILATDKLGKLKLSPEACRMRDEFVFTLCMTNKIPVQVSMGGGYSMHIKDIVNAHCQTFKIAVDLYNF